MIIKKIIPGKLTEAAFGSGNGAIRVTARGLLAEVNEVERRIREIIG